MSTVYSGWSSGWKPSGSSVTKKFRSKLTYSTSSTNEKVTVTASVAVNLNSSVSASFEAGLFDSKSYDYWKTGKTVFGESNTVTIISDKKISYNRTTSSYKVTLSGSVSSDQGAWVADWDDMWANATITIPARTSYTISYDANGGSGAPGSQLKYYGYDLELSKTKPTRVGYTFKGWSTSSTAQTASYAAGGIYKSNTGAKLYAVWSKNTYTVSFDGNGKTSGSVPASQSVIYDTSFIPPSPGDLEKDNYNFDKWNTKADGTGTDFNIGESSTWNIASDTILYAKWKSKLATVNYRYATSIDVASDSSYVVFDEKKAPWESDYTIINQDIPSPTSNYIFSGYYSIGSAYKYAHKEFGIEFPIGIIPYNFTKSDLVGSNIIEATDEIHIGSTNVDLYAIYRDNTNSLISIKNSSYEYIPPSVTENDYYLYLTGQISSFNSSVSNDNVVASIKLSINQIYDIISIDFDSITASLTTENGSGTVELKSPIFYKSLYNPQTNTIDTYIIFRTSGKAGEGTLFDYDTTRYVLSVSNINDSFGKSLLEEPMTIIISPPKILRDINSDGGVISLFSKAPDYEIKHTDNEILINGDILLGLFKYGETSIDTQLYNIIVEELNWNYDIVEIEV